MGLAALLVVEGAGGEDALRGSREDGGRELSEPSWRLSVDDVRPTAGAAGSVDDLDFGSEGGFPFVGVALFLEGVDCREGFRLRPTRLPRGCSPSNCDLAPTS